MIQEQKELLVKDLCARLPYEVKGIDREEKITIRAYIPNRIIDDVGISHSIENVKPYLFPMSSMTEEQKEELRLEHEKDVKIMANCLKKCSEGDFSLRGKNILYHAVDWCNKNHFDYRGLIPMDLAKDATNLGIY